SLAPVENQIRGKENELNFRRQFRQQFCDFNVHPPCQRGICLRPGNGADGRAMNEELWFVFLKFTADGGKIEQVKPVACQRAHAPARSTSWRGQNQIVSDESVRAADPSEWLVHRNFIMK